MMPMNDKFIQANGAFFNSAMRLGQMALESQSKLARHQMAAVEKCFDLSNKQAALMRDVRDPSDFFSKSAELVSDFSQDMAVMVREGVEIQAEAGGALVSAMQEELTTGFKAEKADA